MARSGGRSGGFRRRAEYPTRSDREGPSNQAGSGIPVEIGLGGIEVGGIGLAGIDGAAPPKDYLDEYPLPGWMGGGSLVLTPGGAVDPFDCARWPGSLYCGENPFGNGFAGIDVSIAANECEAVLQIEPSIGFWRLPPIEIGRRWCDPPPPPPLADASSGPLPINLIPGDSVARSPCMYRVVVTTSGMYATGLGPIFGTKATEFVVWGPFYGFCDQATNVYAGPGGFYGQDFLASAILSHGSSPAVFSLPFAPVPVRAQSASFYPGPMIRDDSYSVSVSVTLLTAEYFEEKIEQATSTEDQNFWLQQRGAFRVRGGNTKCLQPNLPPYFPPALYPPQESMCDCKALTDALKRIERILGTSKVFSGNQGWTLPAKLAGTNTEEKVTYDNYAELITWIVKGFRDSLGDTEYRVTIEDSNLTQEGDQEVTVNIPNLAEGQAELLGLLLQINATLSANFAATSQGLIQSGQATLAASKSAYEVREIADFLGYKTREKAVQVPLMFTPDKNRPDEFLQPSTGNITYMEVDDKNDLSAQLAVLSQAAAIIRGMFGQRADFGSLTDMEFEIKDAVARRSDIDQVITEIEQGFAVPDPENPVPTPYGKPFGQRPRIVVRKRGGWTYGEDS
jgi:hypothetical protein